LASTLDYDDTHRNQARSSSQPQRGKR